MNRSTKTVIVGSVLAGLWWWNSRQPKIKVIRVIPEQGGFIYYPPGIEFEMSVNGNSIRDTYYQGDERQVILSEDAEYYFISEGNDTGAILSIGVLNTSGGFDLIASGYVAYNYPVNQLPVMLS